jgi:hypothetical protein
MREQNETIQIVRKIIDGPIKHLEQEPDCKCIRSVLCEVFEE